MRLPSTAYRVPLNTNPRVNKRIKQDIQTKVDCYRHRSSKEIKARLLELNREWDTERILETSAGILGLLGILLGFKRKRSGWFLFSSVVASFCLQHALQGWCPPVPLIRRFGVRTSYEICDEKAQLEKLLLEKP